MGLNYFINIGKNVAKIFIGGISINLNVYDKPVMTCFDSIFLKNVDVLEVKSITNNYRHDTTAGYESLN